MARQKALVTSGDLMDDNGNSYDEDQVLDLTHDQGMNRFDQLEIIAELGMSMDEERMGEDGKLFIGGSMEYEAFMQDPIVINIAETSDENAAPVVFVGSNGDQRWLPRGRPIRVRRKFVENLAQSIERSYKTPKISANDETDNERPVKKKDTLSYPFHVLSDPRGRIGVHWLQLIFKQARR